MRRSLVGTRTTRRVAKNSRLFSSTSNSKSNSFSSSSPSLLYIGCSEVGVPGFLTTKYRPPKLYSVLSIGGMIPPYPVNGIDKHQAGVSASIEYALTQETVKHVILCAHQNCSAVKGIYNPEAINPKAQVFKTWVQNSSLLTPTTRPNPDTDPDLEPRVLDVITRQNVAWQVDLLLSYPTIMAKRKIGQLAIHMWLCDTQKLHQQYQHQQKEEQSQEEESHAYTYMDFTTLKWTTFSNSYLESLA